MIVESSTDADWYTDRTKEEKSIDILSNVSSNVVHSCYFKIARYQDSFVNDTSERASAQQDHLWLQHQVRWCDDLDNRIRINKHRSQSSEIMSSRSYDEECSQFENHVTSYRTSLSNEKFVQDSLNLRILHSRHIRRSRHVSQSCKSIITDYDEA